MSGLRKYSHFIIIISNMKLSDDIELLHGDCVDLLPKIPAASIDAIITDPPYFLGMTHNGQKGCFNDLAICKPFYDWRSYAFYYPIMYGILGVKNMLVWDKQAGPGNFYTYQHELVIFTTKRNAFNVKGTYSIISGIRSFASGARKTNGEKVHPTQKPVELIEKFIKDSTDEGGTVLDTFMGSGTTGVACINTGRRFIGMELDDNYFAIARQRIASRLDDKNA